MPKTLSYKDFDRRLLTMMLLPSWLSGVIDFSITCIICVGTVLLADYQSSSIRLDYLNYQAARISAAYQDINTSLSRNAFFANLPLFAFWAIVGLVVYLFVTNMYGAIGSTAKLKTEMGYVHANRAKLIREALIHLAIRTAVLIVWILYILFFLHRILPYCLAASLIGTSHIQLLISGSYVMLGIAVMAVALHIHVVLLRLLLLRPRIISSVLYVD